MSAPKCRFIVATDVNNPLLGARGATRVYGPQKGLAPADIPLAEACLKRLAIVARQELGMDPRTPGCGAAGGLGFGLRAFLGAQRRLGFDVFAEQTNLDSHLRQADLVVTGEGAFDRQSMMGKGVGQLLLRARRAGRPCAVLAGIVDLPKSATRRFWFAAGLVGLTSPKEALTQPAIWLERLAEACARRW